jgi:hypothetical protein
MPALAETSGRIRVLGEGSEDRLWVSGLQIKLAAGDQGHR